MSAPNLRSAAAAAMGAALMLTPMAFTSKANAEDAQGAPGVTAASYSNTSLVPSASRAAYDWSNTHPEGAAVAVYLGTADQLPPDVIEQILRADFGQAGVQNVQFYYERIAVQGTGFSLHENGNNYGPYRVEEVRKAVPTVAGQVNLRLAHDLN